ncbi:MAG: cyclopropane-fatty-acyl-phospholipid synthase family protein [Pseudomonadota bacterium]|nr:cyclopropane-fatty-acyl-phospholipid synthase family protein [Pseudomonadota bacterium]
MNTLSRSSHVSPAPGAPAAARVVLNLLGRLRHGVLDARLPDGTTQRFGSAAGGPLRAAITLHDWSVCTASCKSGDIGFAETFIAGAWTSPDLVALIELFIANRDDIEALVYGTWWGSLLYRLRHALRRNSRRGAAKNIHAHYDLGNDFYRLWLDPTLNYSSAWFEGDRSSADFASGQRRKMQRALDACSVRRGDRILEIGCGWGALAEHASREHGAAVTGVTLSAEQLAWAQQRLADAGVAADLRLQDYRNVTETDFDAVVSIEMFEAVGRAWWPAFFASVAAKLKADGKACIQSITIRDDLFERYARSTDFIQQYIFPGGLLPSRCEFRAAAAAAGLEVVDELAFGLDYAQTLRRWSERFASAEGHVRGLGFDSRFIRTWGFYLAYCEAAFAAGSTDVVQFTLRHRPA